MERKSDMYENVRVNVDLTARLLNFYKKESENEKSEQSDENSELTPGKFWEEMKIIANNNVGYLKYKKKENK